MILFLIPVCALAGQVTMAWDPNTPAPDGYQVFQRLEGESFDYNDPAWPQPGDDPTQTGCTIENLPDGTTLYFVVRAYVGGELSGDSNEISFVSGSAPPDTHVIAASAGSNGAITPSGNITVTNGETRAFSFVPNNGYHVDDVLIDGQSMGALAGYTFTNINANHTIEARFERGNQSPQAEAGPAQSVDSNSLVTLDGSGSNDPEGSGLSYQWTQTNTPTVNLTNANQAMATFTAPEVTGQSATLVFELTVTDPQGLSSTDTCLVQVDPLDEVDTDGDGIPDHIDTDDDDDGMPDTWEAQYGLNPLVNDTDEDPDNDGYSNLEEYQAGTNPVEAGVNRQPNTPTITSPQDGDEQVELWPRLKASDFDDPDTGDPHKQTQWRIIDTNSQQVVWDVTAKRRGLTTIRVQRLVLSPSRYYNAMVRYFDQDGAPSEWSAPISFTTDADKEDKNRNKIPDAQEAPAGTDLNNDTIADSDQQDLIMSLTTYDGHYLMAAGTANDPNEAVVDSVESVDPATMEEPPADEAETPYGLLGYRIKVAQTGDSALVSIYLSESMSPTTTQWVSYDSVNGWQDCSENTQVMPDGKMAQRSVQDGGAGDADGTANGIIVDLFGPQTGSPAQDSGSGPALSDGSAASSGEGGRAGCFINTLE